MTFTVTILLKIAFLDFVGARGIRVSQIPSFMNKKISIFPEKFSGHFVKIPPLIQDTKSFRMG